MIPSMTTIKTKGEPHTLSKYNNQNPPPLHFRLSTSIHSPCTILQSSIKIEFTKVKGKKKEINEEIKKNILFIFHNSYTLLLKGLLLSA